MDRIVLAHRGIIGPSVLLVDNKDGSPSEYWLDTNILFNYRFTQGSRILEPPTMTTQRRLDLLEGQTVTYTIADPPSFPADGILHKRGGGKGHYEVHLPGGNILTFHHSDVVVVGSTVTNIS